MTRYLFVILIAVVSFALGYIVGSRRTPEQSELVIKETRITVVDTIPYYQPKPLSELTTGTEMYLLPTGLIGRGWSLCDTTAAITEADSVAVELPTVQRHYSDSTYEAWVSGPLNPRLDSLRVYAPTTVIMRSVWKPAKRWHLGVTAGYGVTLRGPQPYIGIGITYSLFSF